MRSREQKLADAMVNIAEHYITTGESGPKQRRSGNRYEVVLHIDRNQLASAQRNWHRSNNSECVGYDDTEFDNSSDPNKNHSKDHNKNHDPARYYVDPGWGIDEEDARQIACDADVTELIQDDRGDILNYERRSRIVPARLMRALMVRDGKCCRFPGCSHSKFLEAHHVHHWIDGGETKLENLAVLCGAHHRLLHHRQFHMEIWDDEVVFINKHGELLEETLYPQFPDVSTEVFSARQFSTANRSKHPSLFRDHTDRELVDMIHFREDWGAERDKRLWKQIVGR
jgi:hypothetical protein